MPLFRTDPELLRRFRLGEREALERVYRTYARDIELIARYGFRILHKNTRVEAAQLDAIADLVQETFTRAFAERARLSFDGIREYGPFLRTIARNLLAGSGRLQGRELPLDENLDDTVVPEYEELPWADDDTMKAVREYLASATPELRAVHQQRFALSVSQDEAARALGISRQQVRTLEKRLREGLASHLKRCGIAL